jgi:hypothetical protein
MSPTATINILKGELVVKAADATAGVELESANMMVAMVSDTIFDLLRVAAVLITANSYRQSRRHLWKQSPREKREKIRTNDRFESSFD